MSVSALQIEIEMLQSSIDNAKRSLTAMEARLTGLKRSLDDARRVQEEAPVCKLLEEISYTSVKSKDIQLTVGPLKYSSPGNTYCIGTASLPMAVFNRCTVCDMSDFLRGLWDTEGHTVFDKVSNFLTEHRISRLRTYNLFKLPVDLQAREQGVQRVDLPNVAFSLAIILLQAKDFPDFIVVDPRYSGTSTSVNIVNFTRVLHELQKQRVQCGTVRGSGPDALTTIFFQYGNGKPRDRVLRSLLEASQCTADSVIHVELCPGKYEVSTKVGGNCYADFEPSAAKILHELSVIDKLCEFKNKRLLGKVSFVLDSFNGYAVYTAVSVLAYGLVDNYSVFAHRRGKYTEYPTR